jgi:hypothetical protein
MLLYLAMTPRFKYSAPFAWCALGLSVWSVRGHRRVAAALLLPAVVQILFVAFLVVTQEGPRIYQRWSPRAAHSSISSGAYSPTGRLKMSRPPSNKGMKQTSVERIGRSQLIPGVLRTVASAT